MRFSGKVFFRYIKEPVVIFRVNCYIEFQLCEWTELNEHRFYRNVSGSVKKTKNISALFMKMSSSGRNKGN